MENNTIDSAEMFGIETFASTLGCVHVVHRNYSVNPFTAHWRGRIKSFFNRFF